MKLVTFRVTAQFKDSITKAEAKATMERALYAGNVEGFWPEDAKEYVTVTQIDEQFSPSDAKIK